MLRLPLIILVCLGVAVPAAVSAVDIALMKKFKPEMLEKRNSRAGVLELIEFCKSEISKDTNSYDYNWQLSLAYYYLGDIYEKNRDRKKEIFAKGRDAALRAIAINPNGADGHYWLGVHYGLWAEANGILESLFYADDVLNEMNQVIRIDPSYFLGLAFAVRGKVYYYVPEFIFGNKDKAYADMRRALQYGPDLRMNYEYYGEILLDAGRYKEAKEIIKKGLDMPIDRKIELEEMNSLKHLSNFWIKLNERYKE